MSTQEWRNWQTHYFEVVAGESLCGFKSRLLHQIPNTTVFGIFLYTIFIIHQTVITVCHKVRHFEKAYLIAVFYFSYCIDTTVGLC